LSSLLDFIKKKSLFSLCAGHTFFAYKTISMKANCFSLFRYFANSSQQKL